MNILEAVANWYGCPYGLQNCIKEKGCKNYLFVDPRPDSARGVGPGTTGKRTLCKLLDDLDYQIMKKTNDSRLEE
jgi:hypothetical protein